MDLGRSLQNWRASRNEWRRLQKIHQLQVGDIGVLTGSSIGGNVSTGDTIITHSTKRDGLKSFSADELSLRINPIKIPEPVFTVSVEPKSLGNKDVVRVRTAEAGP